MGVGAVAVLVAFTLTQRDNGTGTNDLPLAGSGSAPVNTSVDQPVVSPISLGPTIKMAATPPSAPPTSVAVPSVKAKP